MGVVGRVLQVTAQPQRLGNDKHQHQTQQTEGLEVDPLGFGKVAGKGNVQIDQTRDDEKQGPDQV